MQVQMPVKHKSVKKIKNLPKELSLNPSVAVSNVSPSALSYQITKKISSLAEPKKSRIEDSEKKPSIFQIKPSTLKYKPSARIRKLATPKHLVCKSSNKPIKVTGVSPKALRYMPTQRILELAKPIDRFW